jgi:hypothetical protein
VADGATSRAQTAASGDAAALLGALLARVDALEARVAFLERSSPSSAASPSAGAVVSASSRAAKRDAPALLRAATAALPRKKPAASAVAAAAEEEAPLKPRAADSVHASNPGHKAFWAARGFDSPPWTSELFENTPLRVAHTWPGLLADMREFGFPACLGSIDDSGGRGAARLSGAAKAQLEEMYNDGRLFDHLA